MFASVMPLGDDLDHLEAAIDKVAAAEQLLDVARLHRLAERLDAVRVRAVGELDRSGAYLDDGFPSAAAWVRERCRLSHAVAHATVTLARKLTRLAETSHAFAAGDISRQHVVVIADACTAERAPAIVELEPQLVDAARAATPKQLHAIVRRVTDALDGDEGAPSAAPTPSPISVSSRSTGARSAPPAACAHQRGGRFGRARRPRSRRAGRRR